MDANAYHSRFGGLWIDRVDWREELQRRRDRLGASLAADIETFERDGVIIFEGAANEKHIAAYERLLVDAFENGSDELVSLRPGEMIPRRIEPGMSRRGIRVVDAHTKSRAALDLISTPQLARFLEAIFGEPPLLIQTLTFYQGSEQGLHQDTAYVVIQDRPLELAACWIALEDVTPGSGELMYIRGSHRFPDRDFFNGKKHWKPEDDGDDAHDAWGHWLTQTADELDKPVERFLPKRGDILVWHADLAHGGAPIADPDATRKSLVGHFCPASAKPDYFFYRDDRRSVLHYKALQYASMYLDLRGEAGFNPLARARRALAAGRSALSGKRKVGASPR